ncbi:MAG: PEFG-CTERM sorting domain-containing protein, partial [Candidatus Nitrosotenuis sp.]
MKTKVTTVIVALLFAVTPLAFADESEKHAFASALEETLGHFHALELNLDDNNANLAIVHATHPIAELYDSMKAELQEHDPELDARMQETLTNLRANTVDVTREDAQVALDEARALIEEARLFVVGEELSNDPNFKLSLIKTLLETSAAEYAEAVSDGKITEMAEFQDGSAFVWRSQQIFDEIKADL